MQWMAWTKTAALFVAATVFALPLAAQNSIEDYPGFVDFDILSHKIDAEPHIEVMLKGSLLRLVAEASRIEDDDLAELLYGLKAIRVQGYKLDGRDQEDLTRQLRSIAAQITDDLADAGWDKAARIREDDEDVFLYVLEQDDAIVGLVAIVIGNDDEAVFVNIVGDIDPAEIGRIGMKFNIDVLGSHQWGGDR